MKSNCVNLNKYLYLCPNDHLGSLYKRQQEIVLCLILLRSACFEGPSFRSCLANVLETLRGDGNVLIAVDTAGRVLELAQLLDQIWRTKDAGLGVYSLALLNNVSYNVVEFSKSQVCSHLPLSKKGERPVLIALQILFNNTSS